MFGSKVLKYLRPSQAIAKGACYFAAMKAGILPSNLTSASFKEVTSHAIGIDVGADGRFLAIIPKNSRIPCEMTESYQTLRDNQTTVSIRIFECDGDFVADGAKVHEYDLRDLPARPAGEVKLTVTFKLDESGILATKCEMVGDPKKSASADVDISERRRENLEEMAREQYAARDVNTIKNQAILTKVSILHSYFETDVADFKQDSRFTRTVHIGELGSLESDIRAMAARAERLVPTGPELQGVLERGRKVLAPWFVAIGQKIPSHLKWG
jgi:molecular chaperone DnaK (HSP70)